MAKKEWPTAHIEVYADGRTHLFFENDTPRTAIMSAMITKSKDEIKESVEQGLGNRLQPGRVYRIKIKRVGLIRKTIEFDFDRVR